MAGCFKDYAGRVGEVEWPSREDCGETEANRTKPAEQGVADMQGSPTEQGHRQQQFSPTVPHFAKAQDIPVRCPHFSLCPLQPNPFPIPPLPGQVEEAPGALPMPPAGLPTSPGQ